MADLTSWQATEQLSSPRLLLEPLRVDHATEMATALNDPALHTHIGGQPATREQMTARYRRQVVGRSADGAQRWCNWVLRHRGDGSVTAQAAGYVQATIQVATRAATDSTEQVHDNAVLVAELAWVMAVPFQGRGLAREAAGAMVTWLREHGVRGLVAHVHPHHAASSAVARSIGLSATDVVVDGEVCWRA